METLEVPQGSFELDRHPPVDRQPLRAWDAGDELALHHVAELEPPVPVERTLVVNDAFGALTVALGASTDALPTLLTDSFVSVLAVRSNLERNGLEHAGWAVHSGSDALAGEHGAGLDPFDLVIIKIPKSLGLLEDQLHRIRRLVTPSTVVVGAAMTRHIHRSTLELFETVLGPTRTSLARRKARLIHCTPDPEATAAAAGGSPWPVEYRLPDGSTVVNHAGVHAAGRLDPGTGFLLDHLPTEPMFGTVIDLGCGDGVVGLAVAKAHPDATVVFVDESALAVASAEQTFRRNLGPEREARFLVADVLESAPGQDVVEPGTVDSVIVNPPFHADHAIGDETAWRMVLGAHRALRTGGELRIVGNRHLAHHAKLSRVFGNSEVAASNPKFVVCRAVRA